MKIKQFPKYLIQGFLALLPLIITLYIAVAGLRWLENIVDNILPLLPDFLSDHLILKIVVEILFLAVLLILIAFFGLIVRSVIGKGLMNSVKSFFRFIPGLNSVYKATEQVISVVTSEKQSFFRHPVLVEYPSKGIWAIAFNTGEMDTGTIISPEKRYTVFIPTTPNPTSGFLAIVTTDQIRELDISAEEAIKLILTGGIVKISGNVTVEN